MAIEQLPKRIKFMDKALQRGGKMKSKKEKVSEVKEDTSKVESETKNPLLIFFVGLVLLAVGLFLLSKRVVVQTQWYSWGFGAFRMPSGTVVLPFFIGLIWYFVDKKSIPAKIIMTIGAILIFVTIILSVHIHFVTTDLFDYILILILVGSGSGMLLRTLFKK